MPFDAERVTALVAEFCRRRDVATGTTIRVAPNLDAAFDVVVLKGPDRRWRSIASRPCHDDFPESNSGLVKVPAERAVYDHALRHYDTTSSGRLTRPSRAWCLKHVVVSAQHWARFSATIRTAREHGLGWMVPAHKDVLAVPAPTLRCLAERPDVLHDDNGRPAVEWPDGTGFYFLRGTPFTERLYHRVLAGQLSLEAVNALDNADQRSIALSYMSFDQLVRRSGAVLVNVGVKGTSLYCLPLPRRIARDRVRGYGAFDYFIHMRDASHPEREFIEWVEPRIGARGDAELCQAHAFGITLDQWLSIEQEG